jgi:hypothetical protein
MPFRLGADGSDGYIDCIHLVYTVEKRLGIPTPEFQADWYTAPRKPVLRALYKWGDRACDGGYDGDVVLAPQNSWAFGVAWQQGILLISPLTERVVWCPLASLSSVYFFRTKGICAT